MSLDKTPKSDRFQIMTAVFIMSIVAIVVIIAGLPKGGITKFVCNYAGGFDGLAERCSDQQSPTPRVGSGQLISSRVNSACLDTDGLKISIAFDEPLAGTANVQVFSTGEDYFPSEQGISDSFRINVTIPEAVDNLDLIIPVDAMPTDVQIFGNIVVSEEEILSHVAYFINIEDCAAASTFPSQFVVIGSPIIHSATCLPTRHLMIAFEFEESVPGQYQALVAGTPYQLASVISQPARLFFSGTAPPQGPVVIRLVSAIDQAVVFEETYTPPICEAT